ncbi:MAG: HPF/RaiA family ribosome-associated protein [Gemmatimonadota bacterium]|mgnify:CR=1 FL=1|nr:HPF/RaiA family ribosome-associated protein [Gemmatimonadota bacterium]
MLVNLNTDSNIKGTEELAQLLEAMIRDTLGYLAEHVTRVEIHLSDANSATKDGPEDMRCLLEARPAAHQPIAVSHQAATVAQAADGAADKLKHALERLLGRLAAR